MELYFRPGGEGPPRSFGEMLYRRLGRGITDKFLRPYNEKLYATDLDTLDVDAMGRFFPHADLADIIGNMRPRPPGAPGAGYNATFTYPAGGAVQYIRALLHDLPPDSVACGEPAVAIELDSAGGSNSSAGSGSGSSGALCVVTPRRRIRCARVVSSAPLPALARMAGAPHDPAVFTSNRVIVFNLGFDRKGPRGVHWMYFPTARSASIGSAGTTTSSTPIA